MYSETPRRHSARNNGNKVRWSRTRRKNGKISCYYYLNFFYEEKITMKNCAANIVHCTVQVQRAQYSWGGELNFFSRWKGINSLSKNSIIPFDPTSQGHEHNRCLLERRTGLKCNIIYTTVWSVSPKYWFNISASVNNFNWCVKKTISVQNQTTSKLWNLKNRIEFIWMKSYKYITLYPKGLWISSVKNIYFRRFSVISLSIYYYILSVVQHIHIVMYSWWSY